ncbi:type VI secretion system membrane subunit TssM [Aeromonas cavernicola]|uniref:Type VI secretion system membrane subunit TssM n=1 Tax=Aeromonas cavernicola TaxID=1006623 RepID=A0A2H9U7C1_9GAMM|nr:type VI secretion system membrane subunit TssM [Aeromonas cavernicola]PJG59930.1 type VI secretion system membrane subunit TssM [Aeromonas cavernicola]
MFKTMFTFLRQQLPKLKPSWPLLGIVLWVSALILVWWLGPRLEIREVKPFASLWGRVVFTLLWLWLLLGVASWRVWRNMQQLKAEQARLAEQTSDPLQEAVNKQALFLDRWLHALGQHLGKGARYAMPWYLVLGLPSSGKTSLIHRANPANKLNPRLDSELREVSHKQMIDCWLGEQAVMLDPAGELLALGDEEQEKNLEQHHRLWLHLLSWLSEHRRRQPLNGLVVTVDLAWLCEASVSARKTYAQLMRTRLQELASNINTRLPIYITLTKLDQLSGFNMAYEHLDKEAREAVLGVTFKLGDGQGKTWLDDIAHFWDQWVSNLNQQLPQLMQSQLDNQQRNTLFSFVRQLAGLKDYTVDLLTEMLQQEENKQLIVRGLYVSSVYQRGVPSDAFAIATARRYNLPEPINQALDGESTTYFVRKLFSSIIFPEAHLAGENRLHTLYRRRRMAIGLSCLALFSALLIGGWHYFYRINEEAGRNVLTNAQAFMQTNEVADEQAFGVRQLPRLNLIREATLSFGNYRDRTPWVADLGLYQGDEIGPYVEGSYLQLLNQRFMPAQMQGLLDDLNQAPAGSEEKLAILRVMRMLDDASGRNKELVEQFMANRWQRAFPGQGPVQEQLMGHLDYALDHTNWSAARAARDPIAINTFIPFKDPIYGAQRELGKLPMYQRVYESLKVKAGDALPPDLDVRDEVGPSFDAVFALRNEQTGLVPSLLTWSGFNDFFVKQDKALVDLTAMDAWVLGQSKLSQLSDADRQDITRKINEHYSADYINRWKQLLNNLDVQPLTSPEQALDVLESITGSDQPFLRVLASLEDNTRIRKLSDTEGDPGQAINASIGRAFMSTNSVLNARGTQGPLIQEVNQKLVELQQYLEVIVNASQPGQSALKAMQVRLTNKYADPVFSLQQYARNLPAPLNRWVGQLADQSSQLVIDLAMSSLNQEWQDKVLAPFNSELAGRYPFNPRSAKDASLSEMERFFAPGGILDSFYQGNLKPMVEGDLLKGEFSSPIQTELLRQLERAARIREIFFSQQGNLEVQFALEPLELTANKRRSVINLDGQLLEYAHGRRTKVPLVWPNTMRDGAESKITLVPAATERSPRSEGYVGPWAMFRLMDKGELTQVNEATFDVRFPVDQGSMTYRVYTDSVQNPFTGGLFSQFRLPQSLY